MSVCITGAGRGIGLQLARDFSLKGTRVIAACRHATPELNALSNVKIVEGVDVGSDAGVQVLAEALKGERVDILINNAGILQPDSFDALDTSVLLQHFEVNALGPLRTSKALLPNMQSGSKIVIITSRMGSFSYLSESTSGGRYGYRSSKVAVNMIGATMARDLRDKGIAVGLISPGLVKTDMTISNGYTSYPGCMEPAEACRGVIQVIDGLNLENSGSFWHHDGKVLEW